MKITFTESIFTLNQKEFHALKAMCRHFETHVSRFDYPYNDNETFDNATKLCEQILKHENQ